MNEGRPGALLGTRLSVLAAECADPERFGRGRAYFREGCVLDVEIAPGVVSAQVQGAAAVPYEVALLWRVGGVRPGTVPTRNELVCTCSCADLQSVCKHVVAVLLAAADRVAIDPGLLDHWRGDPSTWEHLPVGDDPHGLAGPAGAARGGPTSVGSGVTSGPEAGALAEFFGERGDEPEFEVADPFPEIAPLGVPARPTPGVVDAAVAECLDAAMDVLRAVYG
jgi:hypothetical protein